MPLNVGRDQDRSLEPKLVNKRQRRLSHVDQMVRSLSAKGLSAGEVSTRPAEVYGASVSRETIAKITDLTLEETAEWLHRPLEQVDAAVRIDETIVKDRHGQVTNWPTRTAIGQIADGTTDLLGGRISAGGDGTKFRPQMPTEIKNHATEEVRIVVCDGLNGAPQRRSGRCGRRRPSQTCAAPDPRHHPARLTSRLRHESRRPATGHHRSGRAGRQAAPRRGQRQLGCPVPGGDPAVAAHLNRVHAVA